MKICYLHYEYYSECGGAGMVTYNLSNELAKMGHEIDIVMLSKNKHKKITQISNLLYVHELYYRSTIRRNILDEIRIFIRVLKLYHLSYDEVKRIKPDIVFDQTGSFLPVCCLYKFFHHIPYGFIIHNDPLLYANSNFISRIYYKLHKFLPFVHNANQIITVNQHLVSPISHTYGRTPIVITNGANIARFKPPTINIIRSRRSNNHKIICVSRMVHDKGLEDAITSMVSIIKTVPDAKLILAGDGPLIANLKKQVCALSLEKNVIFLGYIPNKDIVKYYQDACVYLLPSWNEGFPIVLFEAMGCGLPIVATNVGSVPNVITANNGVIVPIKSPDEIARAILYILGLPDEEYQKMSELNIAIAQTHSWDGVAKRYEEVYRKILTKTMEIF